MHDLDWLVGFHFRLLERRDYDWAFCFDNDASLVVHCLWRILEGGRIRFTSNDDGQKFGLPAPVDLEGEINSRLANTTIDDVQLITGVLDLTIHFGKHYSVQVVPDSSGYESWDLCHKDHRFIATGGGNLAIFDDGRQNS